MITSSTDHASARTKSFGGKWYVFRAGSLLVCNEDLEGGDEVAHRNRLVTLPLLEVGNIVNEDDEVVLLALVVDLGLRSLSLDHFD